MTDLYRAGDYDLIVVGAGHAGCEAALAAARMGCLTLLLTLNIDYVALMPCNPAVGGPGKSHLVRELDALGGEMALNTDRTFIQMRMLNTAKGPAVRALRAQSDKLRYQHRMLQTIEEQPNLELKQGMVDRLVTEKGRVTGVITRTGALFGGRAVVLTTGTYLRGRIIVGDVTYPGAPNGQLAPTALTDSLRDLGFELVRFKTGTPPRIAKGSVDFSRMIEQPGDATPWRFSYLSAREPRPQLSCWLTRSNRETHRLIRDNLHRSPLYSGIIEGVGPRYCPSFEDKVVRFPDHDSHQIFLEPEGWETEELYVQGMNTSMPEDVQLAVLHTLPGLEKCQMIRAGYAIEYDALVPSQLAPTLMSKQLAGLFTAGQINGTSGYEEAAAQGIVAGINAALYLRQEEPVVFQRSEAYLGVMIDDLVTKNVKEPYRILTSRAEYRLLLRQDNADLRLTEIGRRVGLVSDERYRIFQEKCRLMAQERSWLRRIAATTPRVQQILAERGSAPVKSSTTLEELLRRPELKYQDLIKISGEEHRVNPEVAEELAIEIRYAGYIAKQEAHVAKMEKLEKRHLPAEIDYDGVEGLSLEAKEKLKRIRPRTLGQASRIPGVTPADVTVLWVRLEHKAPVEKRG